MGFLDKILNKSGNSGASSAVESVPKTIYDPADGKVIPISEFPDELFSQEVLGPGCGILPAGSIVSAPFSGTVTQVAETLHAVGVTSNDGIEVLIHIGVDTVTMNGKGFKSFVSNGQKINRGDKMVSFDSETIKAAGFSDAIAVVVTNADDFGCLELKKTGDGAIGDIILQVV